MAVVFWRSTNKTIFIKMCEIQGKFGKHIFALIGYNYEKVWSWVIKLHSRAEKCMLAHILFTQAKHSPSTQKNVFTQFQEKTLQIILFIYKLECEGMSVNYFGTQYSKFTHKQNRNKIVFPWSIFPVKYIRY